MLILENNRNMSIKQQLRAWRKGKKATAPGIPRRSPIQVLTGPDVA